MSALYAATKQRERLKWGRKQPVQNKNYALCALARKREMVERETRNI